MQDNYILRIERERDEAKAEAAKWKRLYEGQVRAEGAQNRTVEGLNEEAWGKWVAYRKELGKRPYKTTQVQSWLAQFDQKTQAEIVQQSLTKEWQGLHEIPKQAGKFAKPDLEERFL
jgi:bisphosphoglycerate-dependent phosphoglycerate mutase